VAYEQALRGIKLVLFDIDGVFLEGKERPRRLSGTRVLPALRAARLPFRLVTNNSTHPRAHTAKGLQEQGLAVAAEEIHAALEAAVAVARERHARGRCFVFGEPGLREAAAQAGLVVVDDAPADLVLVGLNRYGDYSGLSRATRCLRSGAALIACHRNRVWQDEGALAVSCGPWVSALEYAAGVRAELVGKPSAAFYEQARKPLGVRADETLMIGDDLDADVAGAQALGMRAGLVLTGKTSRAMLAASSARPDLVLDEVDDLCPLLPGS
jgi:HAD superfamily hydrolase (TIGR01458 family)